MMHAFYKAIADDGRIGVSHISLYFALLFLHDPGASLQPFFITRDQLMQHSKIKSRQTYYRCLNDLKAYGYIQYEPSPDPLVRSVVCLRDLRKM